MIAVISSSHYPDDERIFHKQIDSLIRTGFFVYYFTRSDKKLDFSSSFIKHKNFTKKIKIKDYIKNVFTIICDIKDLSHIQIHETELLPIFKLAKSLHNNPITIYDVHENMEAVYRTFSTRIKPIKEVAIKIRQFEERRFLKYVDKIILANPPISKNRYIKYGIQTTIIENFPEIKHLQNSIDSNIKNNMIIYHGHLAQERGIDILVKSMVDVVNFSPDTILTLIGDFRTKIFEQQIYHLIKELKLSKSIQILSQVPYADIWSHLKQHNIGVIPFKNNHLTQENTPTKLFEMMAVGLKIVCSDLLPIRNFVENSVCWAIPGNTLSLSKAIINLINTSDSFFMVNHNKQLVKEKYNWEIKKPEYISLFNL